MTMKRRELREHMTRLAEEHGFRWADKTKRFLGIHRGILVQLFEWDGEVIFQFVSPSVELGDEVLEDFDGFTHCSDGGLPTRWISHATERDERGQEEISHRGCVISIDRRQIDAIGVETFMQIPDLMAEDFHAHSASETFMCANCDARSAETVALLNYDPSPLCDQCWNELKLHAYGGKLATDQSVNWLFVVPSLIVLTAVDGLIWGFVQQPKQLEVFGILFMLVPVLWAFGLGCAICHVSGGVSLVLRLSLFASVLISVLIGNIWGFRAHLIEGMQRQFNQPMVGPGWMDTVELYFVALPNIWQSEAPFFISGMVGAWIALRFLKSQETIDVQ